MSDKTAILDKLEEYEKTGHYPGAVEDIYALIHHAADRWLEPRWREQREHSGAQARIRPLHHRLHP